MKIRDEKMPNLRSAYHFKANFKTECRSQEDGNGGKKLVIRGYPILFNVETKIYDWWYGEVTEVILPTALEGTKMDGLYLLVGHNPDNVLGREGVNMRLEIDETGLFFECELPNTQLARDWYNLIESGIVDGMSFGFISHDKVNDSTLTRTITHIDELYEITITPFPAYYEASVVAKANAKAEEENARLSAEAEARAKKVAEEKARKEEAEKRQKFIKEMEEW